MVTVLRHQKGNHRFYTVEGDPEVEGLELPNVTSITNVLDKPALVGWAERMGIEACIDFIRSNPKFDGEDIEQYLIHMQSETKGASRRTRDTAAEFGTGLHEIIQGVLSGAMPATIPSEYTDVVGNFVTWYQQSGLGNIAFSELPVYSRKYRYGGTVDAIGYVAGNQSVIIDWKTSNGLYPEIALQLAAYGYAYAEMNNLPFDSLRLIAVRLGKDRPDFETKEVYNSAESLQGFLGAMAIHKWQHTKALI